MVKACADKDRDGVIVRSLKLGFLSGAALFLSVAPLAFRRHSQFAKWQAIFEELRPYGAGQSAVMVRCRGRAQRCWMRRLLADCLQLINLHVVADGTVLLQALRALQCWMRTPMPGSSNEEASLQTVCCMLIQCVI